ncbi:MAG: glycoside hydrolase family 10 protein [Oligosphaeraceae bacterium]
MPLSLLFPLRRPGALLALWFLVLLAGNAPAQEAPGTELRGAWIHSPRGIPGWGWDATVKTLADNGFNALFANLSWTVSGDYPSQFSQPHPSLVREDGTVQDLLQECLDACRKYGVQLHVWVVVCNMGDHTPEPVKEALRRAGRTQEDSQGAPSDYLAPQLPENQELLRQVLVELVTKYPVDGVHLDYIRYPLGEYDCSPAAKRDFQKALGRPVAKWPRAVMPGGALRDAYRQWCRDNVTALVRVARQALREARPEAALSAAVYGYWPGARETVAQDAAAWVEEGLVDFLCPMNYSGKPQEAAKWLTAQVGVVDGRIPLYSGLANYMCETPEALRQEIRDTRTLGAEGFVCFQLKENFARDWLPILGANETARKAPPPRRWNAPRPAWQWSGGEWRVPPWYLFWEREGWTPLVCQVTFPEEWTPLDRKALRPVLLLQGSPAPVQGKVRWLGERTLQLSFPPSEAGLYQWHLEEKDGAGKGSPILWKSTPFLWKKEGRTR